MTMTDTAPIEPLLTVSKLTKRYGGLVANDSIDLTVHGGRVMGIIGPNGAGKTTLLGLLGGATPATSGTIRLAGDDITALPASERARRGIGRTYQIPRPFLDMTVSENLQVAQFSLSPFVSARVAAAERDKILADCGLSDVAHLAARALPLLRRKRLEVARALALKPKLLLLDEVGAGLVDNEVTELIALIKSLDDGVRGIIVVEHVIRVVKECCEDLTVINFGKKFAEGKTADVLASDEVGAIYLGTSHGGRKAAVEIQMSEQPAAATLTQEMKPTTAPLLELQDIFAGYGQAQVLRGVSLNVSEGQVVAILGTNGAGKSTLANVISCALKATSGTVRFAGRDLTWLPAYQAAAAGIAHCMEGRRIFPTLSVEENLLLAARGVDAPEQRRRLDQVYDLFAVLADRRRDGGTSMSGGQQQMLAIGRALMAKPKLVIFDEISLGLAPVMMDRLYDALAKLKADGLTMLVVEQDVERALDLADVAYVLSKGQFTLSGTAQSIRTNENFKHLYFGTADQPG